MLGFCWVGLAFQKRLQTAHEHFGQLRLFPIQPEAGMACRWPVGEAGNGGTNKRKDNHKYL